MNPCLTLFIRVIQAEISIIVMIQFAIRRAALFPDPQKAVG